MRALERIFLYTVLAILVFYVFLVDGNVESQVAIQEEIRARSISIVNDAGQEVITLGSSPLEGEGWIDVDGSISVINKKGNILASIGGDEDGGTVTVNKVYEEDFFPAVLISTNENGGEIAVGLLVPSVIISQNTEGGYIYMSDKDGNLVAFLGACEKGGRVWVGDDLSEEILNNLRVERD